MHPRYTSLLIYIRDKSTVDLSIKRNNIKKAIVYLCIKHKSIHSKSIHHTVQTLITKERCGV